MSFFSNKPRTAQQKAQGAKMRMMIRLVAIGYLVFYIIVPMIRDAPDDDSIPMFWRIVIIVFFIAAVSVIGVISAVEFITKQKTGGYKADAYEDDPGISKPYEEPADIDDEDDEDDEDDFEDDDDYDYDEDDDDDDDDYDYYDDDVDEDNDEED